jgi:DNA ligase-1
VRVGSGLSDEDRAYFWNNQDKIIGKYITVKYFETSTDSKTGLESLRFPIYMRVREDMLTIPLDVNGPRFDY